MNLILRLSIPTLLVYLFVLIAVLAVPATSSAQQPFVTDDADVTPKRRFHFEFSNEFDWLSRNAFPSLRQNTADFELDYGLLDGVEIGIEAPLISIFNAPGTVPVTASGIGDTNVSLKYNFLKEKERSKPAGIINRLQPRASYWRHFTPVRIWTR